MKYMSWERYQDNLDEQRQPAANIWLIIPKTRRVALWHIFMAWAMRKAPRAALIPLDVAIHFPAIGPSQQRLHDCLHGLSTHFLGDQQLPSIEDFEAIYRLACEYVKVVSRYERPYPLQQRVIFLILEHCSIEQARSFFRTLLTYNSPLSSNTLLHFAEYFLDEGEATIALEIIRSAVNMGADLSSAAVQSSCVKLLRTQSEDEDRVKFQSGLLSQILEMGIKPGHHLWTCIIFNAVEAGNYEEAWRWYDMGVRDGMQPSRVTFSVLLKITKRSYSDDSLERVIDEATRQGILPDDLDMIFDILHAISLLKRPEISQGPDLTFNSMLRFYSQYCDLGPLQELGLRTTSNAVQAEPNTAVRMPSSRVIGMMIVGYLPELKSLDILASLYQQFLNLVMADISIATLMDTDHVNNAFIQAFGSRPDGLGHCTMVVKNMLTRTSTTFSASEDFGSTTLGQTGKPTVQTWNILLHSYMKHGHTEAAEKILSMMRARGLEPNNVTWNHIIAGYVRKQDVANVIGTSRRMKDAGHEYNDFTIQALRRLVDKTRYLKEMEAKPLTTLEPLTKTRSYSLRPGTERTAVVEAKYETPPIGAMDKEDHTAPSAMLAGTSAGRSKGDAHCLDRGMARYSEKTNDAMAPGTDSSTTLKEPHPLQEPQNALRTSSLSPNTTKLAGEAPQAVLASNDDCCGDITEETVQGTKEYPEQSLFDAAGESMLQRHYQSEPKETAITNLQLSEPSKQTRSSLRPIYRKWFRASWMKNLLTSREAIDLSNAAISASPLVRRPQSEVKSNTVRKGEVDHILRRPTGGCLIRYFDPPKLLVRRVPVPSPRQREVNRDFNGSTSNTAAIVKPNR